MIDLSDTVLWSDAENSGVCNLHRNKGMPFTQPQVVENSDCNLH